MKAVVKVDRAASGDSEKQLKGFIDKFEPKHQALIRATRKALRKRLPLANELAYDNYNFFVLGYCSSERPSDCILSIAAGANPSSTSLPCQLAHNRQLTLRDRTQVQPGSRQILGDLISTYANSQRKPLLCCQPHKSAT